MADCVFCKMVAGDIPAAKIYEDDNILAFLDINPVSEGHTLVIPKQHYTKVDQTPSEILAAIASKLNKIADAVIKTTDNQSYNILCNNGRSAGQLVEHLHFHIIPRQPGDKVLQGWPAFEYPKDKIEQLAENIRKNL